MQCINLSGTDECTRGNVLLLLMNGDVLTFDGDDVGVVVGGNDGLCVCVN